MKADRIMDALGKVKEDYIMESAPDNKKMKKSKKSYARWIAAAIAIVAVATFSFTTPGVAAAEKVKQAATSVIQTLFPPKDGPISVEGEIEIKHQEAAGQEAQLAPDGSVKTPGFAIYYDTEIYTKSEENGITYIKAERDDELPPCEAEIKHVALAPKAAAQNVAKEMQGEYANIEKTEALENKDGVGFRFSDGDKWNSACGYVYFISDGKDGCFQITAKYFVEAAEGHGARLAQMADSFKVIDE